MSRVLTSLLTACIFVFLTGCISNPSIILPPDGEALASRDSDGLLSVVDDSDGSNTRVIIRARQPVEPNKRDKERLSKRLYESLYGGIGGRSLAVVNRQLDSMLKSELDLASIYGIEQDRDNVDALILVVIDEYETRTESSTKKTLLNKKTYGKCEYETQFSGYLRIQSIPKLTQLAQFDFSEKESSSFKAPNNANACNKGFASHISKLNKQLLDYVVCKNKDKIANVLAPTGHVIGREVVNEAIVLEISLGSDMGVSKGDKLRLYHELSGEHYAELKVNQVYATTAKAILTKMDKGATLYLHDFVRPYNATLVSAMKCFF